MFIGAGVLSAGQASAQATRLYDVNFEGPTFVPGQVIPASLSGLVRTAPSSILTTPITSNTFGPMPGKVAELSPPANVTAEYIGFDVFATHPAYRMKFDLCITTPGTAAGGGFTLFADVPTIRPIRWVSDGRITGLRSVGGSGLQIGTWNLNQVYAVDTLWDLQQQSMTLWIDGQQIVTEPFSATQIVSFRLATGNNPSFPGSPTVAGVDNIVIEGLVPAPTSAACLGVLGCWMGVRRQRRN
jgi:hypothetical protein